MPCCHKQESELNKIAEERAKGIINSSENRAIEMPGSLSAASDAAKEMAMGVLLLSLFLKACQFANNEVFWLSLIFTLSWAFWKGGRSSWLSWSRLEKLHRILIRERYSIEHHRSKERATLAALYSAKGFQGKLLDEVLDVLMADDERLLSVLVQEKLGLNLESFEHPLKQGLWACLGTLIGGLLMVTAYFLSPFYGMLIAAVIIIGSCAAFSSYLEGNQLIPAIIWNLGIATVSFGTAYFLFEFLLSHGFSK